MKILVLFFCFSILAAPTFSQDLMPKYHEVVSKFYNTYSASEDNENYTSFAKKKEGWYVTQINRLKSDVILEEYLFWSNKLNSFQDIRKHYNKATDSNEQINEKMDKLFSDNFSLYNFNVNIYYGYNNWDIDVINDFRNNKNLKASSIESLSRAYKSIAGTYLWYQYGGFSKNNDTSQQKLGSIQLPSEYRMKKVRLYLDSSILKVKELEAKFPDHKMLIGNSHLKVFNEVMNGYMQMLICQNNNEANYFLNQAKLNKRHIDQGKNYLNSCDSNAILISFGDNDTFQPWYIQEKENFRNDISVVNVSMLGLPAYVNYLSVEKKVNISTPPSFYGDPLNDVSYFSDLQKDSFLNPLAFKDFEKLLYSKQYSIKTEVEGIEKYMSAYPTQEYFFTSNDDTSSATIHNIQKLKNYTFINDLLVLSIIQTNLGKRPIYFTSLPTDYINDADFHQQGINYKLSIRKEDGNNIPSKYVLKENLINFVENKFIPVLSTDSLTSYDGDNCFAQIYAEISQLYYNEDNIEMAQDWIQKAINLIPNPNLFDITGLSIIASQCITVGNFKNAKKFLDIAYRTKTANYFLKNGLSTYLPKNAIIEEIEKIISFYNLNNLDDSILKDCVKKLTDEKL